MRRVLIYIEDGYDKQGLDLLQAAKAALRGAECETHALVFSGDISDLSGAFDCILDARGEELVPFDIAAIAALISQLHAQYRFDCILMSATRAAVMLAPRLAFRTDCGLVSDVTAIEWQDDTLTCFRPAQGGRIRVGIAVKKNVPPLLTVRPGCFHADQASSAKPTRIVQVAIFDRPAISAGFSQVSKHRSAEADIRNSAVLVAGGGGIAKNFEQLQPLAEALGGEVAASRAVVDRGLAPRSIQVGQSGTRVSPRLYIALGIHGAIQHVTAIRGADYVISVNTNENAPICSLSDLVVVGDALTFVDALLRIIKEEKGNGNV